jgi:hypothetical protein
MFSQPDFFLVKRRIVMQRLNVILWKLVLAVIVGHLGVTVQQASAGSIAVAEKLLVDLRAEDLKPGSVSEWPNRGSLGGVFTAVGAPMVVDVGGWESVSLDGASYFEGPTSVPGIEGGDPRSVEVWAYKAANVSGERTMVSWAHRGGPDGTNFGFNYADDPSWGAVGHWGGGPDMGWSGAYTPQPPVENWWYLVYTYDGATARLYVNGDPAGEEAMTLNTHAGSIIRVGAQGDDSGDSANTAMNFIGAIAQVRIHDGVLTPEQIQKNSLIRIQSDQTASNPSPGDGDTDVSRDAALSWQPGETAQSRNVYIGTVFDDVDSSMTPAASGLSDTAFDPGRLEFDTTYFWRVDEVNGTPDRTVFKGDIWSFTAEPYSIMVPVDITKATASSSVKQNTPDMTVNGSGLVDGVHSTDQDDMWLSAAADLSPWLMYEFDTVQKLDKMLIWNSNSSSEGFIGWGIKDVGIATSLDGVEWTALAEAPQIARAPGLSTYNDPQVVDLGLALARYVRVDILSNWGGFLKQYGVAEVQFYGLPVYARTPSPADQAVDVLPDVTATWRAGREADRHQVLVSQDPNAMSAGASAVSNTSRVDMADLGLLLGETYYWQVVEVNENMAPSQWAGDVWSFSTTGRVMVDDFEGYTNYSPDRPFQTWLDGIGYSADEYIPVQYNGNGSGAAVGHDIWSASSPYFNGKIMEQTLTAEASSQSMPIYYSGNSQADRVFAIPQDWSMAGIKTLVLYFNGARDNDPGTLYVTINNKRVDYPKAGALTSGVWTPWNIDLASLGIALNSITNMSIGIDSTGSGVVYVDQISLYREAPEAPVSADPGSAGLVAQYRFENDYTDSSGHNQPGTPMGAPQFESGLAGNGFAVTLNGNDDSIELPIGQLISTLTDSTFALWANFSGQGGAWQRLIDFGSGTTQYILITPARDSSVLMIEINGPGAGTNQVNAPMQLPAGWHHVAGVIDSSTMQLTLYLDGTLVGQGPTDTVPADLGVTTQNWLGDSQYAADPLYDGSLDELYIYNRVLSEGEIRYLAGDR